MQSVQLQDLKTLGLRQKWCLAIEELANPILHVLPFLLGSPIRRLFLKLFAREVGREVFIANHVSIRHVYNLRMGNHIGINQDVIIHCRGGVTIGNDVLIGQRVIINTGDHVFQDPDTLIRKQPTLYLPVRIGNDVFLGMGSMILPGVEIADGTVVAAGAVVTKNTEPYSVVAGVPARTIRRREKTAEVPSSR